MIIKMLYKHFNFSITGCHGARTTCGPIEETTSTRLYCLIRSHIGADHAWAIVSALQRDLI